MNMQSSQARFHLASQASVPARSPRRRRLGFGLSLAGLAGLTAAQIASALGAPPSAQAPATQPQPAQAPATRTVQGADGHNHTTGQTPHQEPHKPPPSAAEGQQWPKNGRLEVDKPDHDFGQRFEGEVLVHTFKMKSAGEGPLHISTAKPTCGCTVSQLEVISGADRAIYNFGDPIPSGTQIELTAQLDTKNKHSAASSKININCNDPRGTVTVGLVAALDTYFMIAPNQVDFGDVPMGAQGERSFEVIGKKPEPFKLTLDKAPPTGLKVEITPLEPTAEGKANRWSAKVQLTEEAKEGMLMHPISLSSDQLIQGAKPNADGSPAAYSATVMARGNVRGPIAVDQLYLGFGLIRPGQVASRTVKLTTFDPNFKFGPLEAKFVGVNEAMPTFKWADHFSVAFKPSEDNKSVQLELSCNGLPEDAEGSWAGRLMVQTGHAQKPEIALTFSGILRSVAVKPPTPTPTPVGGAGQVPPGGSKGG